MGFQETDIHSLEFNPFDKISKQWMLITVGDEKKSNTMTASWGGMGILWNKKVAFVFILPQRYTKELIDQSGKLSLSFFDEGSRKMLNYMGTVSGRDEDKIAACGLHVEMVNSAPVFQESRMAIICRKLYAQPMEEACFLDQELIAKNYPDRDYHTVYVVEIEKILVQKQ